MEGFASAATPLVSGEGVRLELVSAGIGSRLLAAVLDGLVQIAAMLVLLFVSAAAAGGSDSAAVRAMLIAELVLVLAGYPITVEWLTKGRTLGKMALGLRVVRDDGGPIGFRHALVRGLAGLILEKPGVLAPLTTVAGMVTTGLSTREKRIGDMMAGTVVLNEHSAPQALAMPPAWVPEPMQHWVLSLEMSRVDDALALAMRQFVTRAYQMSNAGQHSVGEELRARLAAVTAPPPPTYASTPDILMAVLAERRRRAAAGETGPWRPAQYPAQQASTAPTYTKPSPGMPSDDAPFIAPN